MPSAKNSKSSTAYLHHPPTNRAFALRMMNSAQNTEGRMSPLDRALKPFKESFKKSNKSKRAKDKNPQSPTTSYHSVDESENEETPGTSFDLLWTSQLSKAAPESNANGGIVGNSQEKVRHPATFFDHQSNVRLHSTHRVMADIAEEEESSSYGQVGNHYLRIQDNLYNEIYSDSMDSNWFGAINLHSKHIKKGEQVDKKHTNFEKQVDLGEKETEYFIAPNGEVVRLRKKKQDGENGNRKNGSGVLRTERFGKRLSLLCHMLAEKYPEDFHILELLVELQVSNEKREEEMNRSVSLLKQKLESMEDRLAQVEKQSLSGFQKMLMPLAVAAEVFSKGMKDSLSNIHQYKDTNSNGDTANDNKNNENSEDEHIGSLNATFIDEKEIVGMKMCKDSTLQISKDLCNGNCQLEYSKEKLNDNGASELHTDAITLTASDIPLEDKGDIYGVEVDESTDAEDIKEIEAGSSPNPSRQKTPSNAILNKNKSRSDSDINLATLETKHEQTKIIYETTVSKQDEIIESKSDITKENKRGSIVLLASETSV